jgi:hypothetical protein
VVSQSLGWLDARFSGVYLEEIGQEQQDAINKRTKRPDQTAATKAAMAQAKVAN